MTTSNATTAATGKSATSRSGGARGLVPLGWAVLAAAILEVVAPVVTINGPGSSPGQGSGPDLLITPVGWAFSIWGVIYALAIAQAVAALVRGVALVPRRLQIDQIVLYAGGALWIVLAGLDSSVATAGALTLMLAAGVDGVLTAARRPMEPGWLSVLTRASIGLFAGWVTAAFFLNLSTALVDSDVVDAEELGWQLAVLAVAATTLLVLTWMTRGNVAFAAAGTWALIGIAVTASTNGTTAVIVLAVVAAVAVTSAAAVVLRIAGRHSAPTDVREGKAML